MLFRRSNLRCYWIASGEVQERPRNDMAIKSAVMNGGFFLSVGVCFPGCYSEIQMILLGSEDACGEICEGAGWVVGFVEIYEYMTVGILICDKIAAGGVGFIFAGQV